MLGLTSLDRFVEGNDRTSRCSGLSLDPNLDIGQPAPEVEAVLVPGGDRRRHVVVELGAANGAILAAALDELHNAEPVEGVVAREPSPLSQDLLAYRAVLPLSLGIIDQRVVLVYVS